MKTVTYDETQWVLVPSTFSIPADALEAAQFAFGGPGTGDDEPFFDCTAWVGECEDDDGTSIHGLHISCDERPEGGSVTLAEFPAAPVPPAQPAVSDDGMCNPENPKRRCVCREEFGYRVCEPKGGV